MKYEEALKIERWLDANEDKWHIDVKTHTWVWDVPLDQIPPEVQKYPEFLKQMREESQERLRIRKQMGLVK